MHKTAHHTRGNWGLIAGLALVFLMPRLGWATSGYTYSYTGTPYGLDTHGAFLTASPPFVSGSFTVSSPLPPNSQTELLTTGLLTQFSFNNGLETIDNNNGVIYSFIINTDAQGKVVSSGIQVQRWTTSPAVGGFLNDIEIIEGNHRSYQNVECTELRGMACRGLNYIAGSSSYGRWSSGIWLSPLVVVPAQSTITTQSSTTLSTLGGSGSGAISYQLVSGPCTLTGATLTGNTPGNCVVTATQAADQTHPQAISQPVSITVTEAQQSTLTVSATPSALAVGGTAILSATGGSGTGALSYQLVSGPCTLSGTTVTGNAPGYCTVTATKAGDATYSSATSSPVSIPVAMSNQAPLKLQSTPTALAPGQRAELSATGGSGTGAVHYQLVSGPCSLSAATLTAQAIGSCIVIAEKSGSGLYGPIRSNPLVVAVTLTPQVWSDPPYTLSTLVSEENPQLALSRDGRRAVAIWVAEGQIQAAGALIQGNTAAWSVPTALSASVDPGFSPVVSLSADGTRAVALWGVYRNSESEIRAAVGTLTGSGFIWGSLQTLSAQGLSAYMPQIALAANGSKAVALWFVSTNPTGTLQSAVLDLTATNPLWGSTTNVTSAPFVLSPSIALSTDGTRGTAGWILETNSGMTPQSASATLAGNTIDWGSVASLTAAEPSVSESVFSLSGDGGTAVAVWRASGTIRSSLATITGSSANWGGAVNLATNSDYPKIALSEDGRTAIAVWVHYPDQDRSLIQSAGARLLGGTATWTPQTTLSFAEYGLDSPQVALSADGRKATALWSEFYQEELVVASSSATVNQGEAVWGGAGSLPQAISRFFLEPPKLKLSADGTQSTALWISIDETTQLQSSSASIGYGPPPVLNLLATPGPGYIQLDFTPSQPGAQLRSDGLTTRVAVLYTGVCTSTDGGVTASARGTGSPLQVTGVTPYKTYTCRVTGTDGSGSTPSEPSNAVTPLPAAIPVMSDLARVLLIFFMGWMLANRLKRTHA